MRLFLLFSFCTLFFAANAQTFDLFIGTYTGSGSKGIYVYRFNAANGNADWVSNTDSVISNPSFLATSGNGYVYAVNETADAGSGSVSSFKYNKPTGKLSFINSQLSGGEHPCYVALSKNNKWVAVANYNGGNVSLFPVDADGSLLPFTQLIQDTGSSANRARQEKAHVHAAVFSPDNRFLFTPDLGTDKVMIYSFEPSSSPVLTPATPPFAASVAGSGPRHFTFSPNQKFAYLAEELTGTVAVFKYNKGKLHFIQRTLAHPDSYKGNVGSADIHLSPDGNFLYMSNRGDENTLAIFSVNNTGKLTLKGYQSTLGKTPRNFTIDPTGNFLLVANQETDNIVIFKRNKLTGLLTATRKEIKIPKPVCLLMVK